jgi:hypothetical protein
MTARVAAATLGLALAVLSVAGCTPPHRDSHVPPSRSPLAACPHGDAGRIKDVTLPFPAQWACVR